MNKNKTYACITSMNQAYYDHCGKSCILTMKKYWPENIPLYVYNEDMKITHKGVNFIDWSELVGYTEFSARHTGRTLTFAKKAFSIMHAMENLKYDRIIWLDADAITTTNIPLQLFDLLTPDEAVSSHFGVKHAWPSDIYPHREAFSCETGFFIINTLHPRFEYLRERYREYYEFDLVESLRRFYDGDVYGAVISELMRDGVPMLELNSDVYRKTPIPKSILAPYITHYKAGRKDSIDNQDFE